MLWQEHRVKRQMGLTFPSREPSGWDSPSLGLLLLEKHSHLTQGRPSVDEFFNSTPFWNLHTGSGLPAQWDSWPYGLILLFSKR